MSGKLVKVQRRIEWFFEQDSNILDKLRSSVNLLVCSQNKFEGTSWQETLAGKPVMLSFQEMARQIVEEWASRVSKHFDVSEGASSSQSA